MKQIIIYAFALVFSINSYSQKNIDIDYFGDILNQNRIFALKNNNWGVIDTLGNTIIDFKIQKNKIFNGKMFGNSRIQKDIVLLTDYNGFKYAIFDYSKDTIYKIDSVDDIRSFSGFNEDYAIINTIKKTSSYDYKRLSFLVNRLGKKILKLPNKGQSLRNGPIVKINNVSENKMLISEIIDENKDTRMYYYIDTKGNKLFNKNFDYADDFHENRAIVGKNINGFAYYGFINEKGKLIIDYKFTNKPTHFVNGRSRVKTKDKFYGFIDKEGNLVIEPKYKYASGFFNNYALSKNKSGELILIDTIGNTFKTFKKIRKIDKNENYYDNFFNEKVIQIFKNKLFIANVKGYFNSCIVDINENIFYNYNIKLSFNKSFNYNLLVIREQKETYLINSKGKKLLKINKHQF